VGISPASEHQACLLFAQYCASGLSESVESNVPAFMLQIAEVRLNILTPQSGQKPQSLERPLSVVSLNSLIVPVSMTKESESMTRLMPNALPDCFWQSEQWHMFKRMGCVMIEYRTSPH